jgi:ComF family protein
MLRSLLAPPLCWSCRAPAARGSPLCRACRGELRFLPRAPATLNGISVWAPVAYEGPARELVKALKFSGATAVASEMAALIAAGAPEAMLEAASALVPVPLHPARRRARGFNQAEAIAAALGVRTGLAAIDCLTRAGPERRQVGRGRTARLAGPAGAIDAARPPPRAVVLVDDVVTTGATLVACAAALRKAGAQAVAAVAFARTGGR